MTDSPVDAPGPVTAQTAGPASGGAGSRRFRGAGNYLALLPFHLYVGVFLILPTLIVAIGAFTTADGQPTLDNVSRLFTDSVFVDDVRQVHPARRCHGDRRARSSAGSSRGRSLAAIRTGSCASS